VWPAAPRLSRTCSAARPPWPRSASEGRAATAPHP
jgi:hypothetical protein